MKKIVFFAIIVFSINAFAQSKQKIENRHYPILNSGESLQDRIEDCESKTPEMFFNIKIIETINHQTSNKLLSDKLIQQIDSIYTWQWDTISIGWKINFKNVEYVYDANNMLTSFIIQKYNDSAWENSSGYIYFYDTNNNQTSDLVQYWNDSAWVNSSKGSATFDENNNRTSYFKQRWNGSGWMNSFKNTYTYDVNNKIASILYQTGNGSEWQNSSKTTYNYDANNILLGKLTQVWNFNNWENSSDFTYSSFDANNNPIIYLGQFWNGFTWGNSYKHTYTYDTNNNKTNDLEQNWNSSTWENSWNFNYTFDANNNQIFILVQNWNDSAWVNNYQFLNSYDANNFENAGSAKHWNSDGSGINSGDSTHYYFHTIITGIPGFRDANITIYPNPGKGNLTINSTSPITDIEIYNLSGKRVYSDFNNKQQTSKEIDLSGYAKGIYIIKIYSGTEFYTRKVVVQ